MPDALPKMVPLAPLGGTEPRVETHGPITLAEVTDTAIASYACRRNQEADASAALASFLAVDLPDPGRMVSEGVFRVFWIGPAQWMVTAPHQTHEDLAQRLREICEGCASITEQNDAWCRFDLIGDGLIPVFERLCPINMRATATGHATRTSIDHMGCFVLMVSTAEVTVLGPRSSAGSLHHSLRTAIRSAH